MSSEDFPQNGDEAQEAIDSVMAGLRSGDILAATIRVKHSDGTVEDYQIGYESDEERDVAMARMLKDIGQLH